MAKRTELEIGQEWAHVTGQAGKYSLFGDKVTIVAIEPYEYNRYTGKTRQVSGGQNVLVSAMYYYGGGEPKQANKVVQLRHLVELWEPYSERTEKTKAERAEMEKRRKERQDYRQNVVQPKVEQVVKLLKTSGHVSEYTALKEMEEGTIDYLIQVLKFYEDYR